jgi:hypothetical protein
VRAVEIAEVTTEIGASPAQVWAVLTDFPRYSEWTRYIQEVEGSAEVGARLRIVVGRPGERAVVAHPPVLEATPEARLAWAAVIPGATWLPAIIFGGVHEFVLTALPDGGTRFLHREHLSGLLAGPAKKKIHGAEQGFAAFNIALKHRAEKGNI